jgi:hypothetical protein
LQHAESEGGASDASAGETERRSAIAGKRMDLLMEQGEPIAVGYKDAP